MSASFEHRLLFYLPWADRRSTRFYRSLVFRQTNLHSSVIKKKRPISSTVVRHPTVSGELNLVSRVSSTMPKWTKMKVVIFFPSPEIIQTGLVSEIGEIRIWPMDWESVYSSQLFARIRDAQSEMFHSIRLLFSAGRWLWREWYFPNIRSTSSL